MKLDYNQILLNNLINVFKDILLNIETNGLKEGHHLYVTFDTQNKNAKFPSWLIEKYPKEMTIVIQHEYWNFKVKKESFTIGLSFSDIKVNLNIPYKAVISFADPYANFGLKLIQEKKDNNLEKKEGKIKKEKKKESDNIINFTKYKKNKC